MAKKKLIRVRVGFKYSYEEQTPEGPVFHVRFPELVSDEEDLKGRREKDDKWWFDFALKKFHEFKQGQVLDKFNPREFWIRREYKEKVISHKDSI